jgi:hypothetical protein
MPRWTAEKNGDSEMNFLKRLFGASVKPEAAVQLVVDSAKKALGEELVGILAYGSWASGEFIEGFSNVDLLVLVKRLDPETLKRMAPTVSSWRAYKGVKPRVFSMQELRAFSEALPMEFGDIAENRRLLAGEDPFLKLQISNERLLEELEAEVRNRLVKLRQRYLLCGGNQDEVRGLLIAVTASFFPILRGFLRLKRRKAPRQRVRLIEECCRNYRFSRRTLLQAHDLRYGRKNAERLDVADLFSRVLFELQGMAETAARMRSEGGAGGGSREHAERGGERGERGGERGERGDRERGERDRGDRDRGDRGGRGRDRERGERGRSGGGDRNAKLAQVRQLMQEAGARKKWEPKEPERFVADEFSRDISLSYSARFGWDRAWQPERKAKGYVPVLPPKPEVAEEEPYSDDELNPEQPEAGSEPSMESAAGASAGGAEPGEQPESAVAETRAEEMAPAQAAPATSAEPADPSILEFREKRAGHDEPSA